MIIDELPEYNLKGRKYSDHNTFLIDIITKTKHLEAKGKSFWKINEKIDWKKYKRLNTEQNTNLWLEWKPYSNSSNTICGNSEKPKDNN